MRIFFMAVFAITALFSSVPNTTKELQDKMALQNAQNMFIRAIELHDANQTDKTIEAYRELIDKFENSTNREIKTITAQAMFNLALEYNNAGNIEAENRLYGQIISKFANLNDTTIETITANSFFNQALIAYRINDTKGEMQIYEKFIERFRNTNNENISIILANVMANLGYVYAKEDKKSEAIDIYNEFIYKFEDSKNEYVQILFAGSLLNLSVIHIEMGELKDGLASYQRLIEQFKNSANHDILQKVGAAVTNKIELEICNDIKPSFNDENKKLADKSEYSAFMYEFLQIIHLNTQQIDKLNAWRDKYSHISFKKMDVDFDFSDLDRWVKQLKNPKRKWVQECIDALKEFGDK